MPQKEFSNSSNAEARAPFRVSASPGSRNLPISETRATRADTRRFPARSFAGRRGVTLPEMLAVVFIVSLLAALLFPALAKQLEKAREVECAQRMRQLGIAFHAFAGDHNQTLPVQKNSAKVAMKAAESWTAQLYPYTESYEIMACPSCPKANIRVPNTYGYNANVALSGEEREGGANHNPHGLDAVRLTMSREPSKDVLLLDHYSTSGGSATLDGSAQGNPVSASTQAFFPHPRPGKDFSALPAPPSAIRTVLYVNGNIGILRPVKGAEILAKNWKWPSP